MTLRQRSRIDRGGDRTDDILPVAALAERRSADREGQASPLDPPAPHDYEDLQLELALIERKLDAPVMVDSENTRSTRAILERQHREITAKLLGKKTAVPRPRTYAAVALDEIAEKARRKPESDAVEGHARP